MSISIPDLRRNAVNVQNIKSARAFIHCDGIFSTVNIETDDGASAILFLRGKGNADLAKTLEDAINAQIAAVAP